MSAANDGLKGPLGSVWVLWPLNLRSLSILKFQLLSKVFIWAILLQATPKRTRTNVELLPEVCAMFKSRVSRRTFGFICFEGFRSSPRLTLPTQRQYSVRERTARSAQLLLASNGSSLKSMRAEYRAVYFRRMRRGRSAVLAHTIWQWNLVRLVRMQLTFRWFASAVGGR